MKSLLLKFSIVFLLPTLLWAQKSERDLSRETWSFRKKGDVGWLPAKVPGTVHTDLFTNEIIPDPFSGSNEKQLQWIENEDWQYHAVFSVSEKELNHQNIILQFEGLDTFAEITLNGSKILSTDNMFRTWKVDVKNLLKMGQNKLEITFASAAGKAKSEAAKLKYTLPGDEKIFARKAQYHFGWDWGPRFVTAGIWKNVKLQFWDEAVLDHVKFEQKSLSKSKAKLEFKMEINSAVNGNFSIKVNDKFQKARLKKGKNQVVLNYEISNPKLWWTNGLGDAQLYPFEISLLKNRQVIDTKKLNIGLRTIELVQEKDKIGKSFYFKLNGVPVFMKGANVIPPDSFLPRATDSVYQSIVKNAKDANMNMLRVWGGGVYADDAFYDACDKNGILVWQDFMFACAMYPGDEYFLDNVREEVIDNVSRLQNHPSIALWCGNNENDEGWHNWGWQKQYKYTETDSAKIWNDYKKLFYELIPQTLDSILPKNENRYWPSSPSIGWGRKESLLSGDSHYWGVWWGLEPFEMYQQKVGRFMSEYGFQSMPDLKTFLSFAGNDELNFDSESVKNHQKHPTGYKTIDEYMSRDFKIPTNFEDYIYVSQLLQAHGMKIAIEAHRTATPYCMGTLFWQLNDCWPVTSWSSVDYFGRWKAFQYQAKRSFENVAIFVQEKEGQYNIFISNDDLKPHKGKCEQKLMDFNGKIIWESGSVITLQENSGYVHYMLPTKELPVFDLNATVLSVKFKSDAKSAESLHYFVKPKDLKLKKPKINIIKIDELTYEVSSDVLAKNVFLFSEDDTFFSDNYFDLLPNEKITIKLTRPVKQIRLKSLFDTM